MLLILVSCLDKSKDKDFEGDLESSSSSTEDTIPPPSPPPKKKVHSKP